MQLPFSIEQFFGVFRAYNERVWPSQYILVALALFAVALAAFPRRNSGRGISAVLGLLWVWIGAVYQLLFFTAINPLAYAFSALSVAGGAVFFWQGVVHRRLEFRMARTMRARLGLALIVFALIIYPTWSVLAGHAFPELPTFGLPCPVTLFTIGMLGLAVQPYPRMVLAAPSLWCLVGGQGAFLLDLPQDLGLFVAALFAVFLMVNGGSAGSVDGLRDA